MHFAARWASALACAAALAGFGCGDARADREIAQKVDQEITNSPVLGDTQINVAARDGVVTLTGFVASPEQADSAEKLAWSVEGVEGVDSRIEVMAASAPELPPVGAPPEEPR
jgi:osmotically-inducible protein OsmY